MLDGEGGFCVWGRQLPAADSLARNALPLGLAADVRMRHDVERGEVLSFDDVEIDETNDSVKARREMEKHFRPAAAD